MNLLQKVESLYKNAEVLKFPEFRAGDEVCVGVKIVEGTKSRIQNFQGVCIAIKKANSLCGNFRVRKVSSNIGVERVFPFHSEVIDSIKVITKGKSRRAKHYFLRNLSGKQARISVDYSRK